ncbi:heavy metal sensor kinase [Inhella inkyongensis]|uniref:histidine kinase n=1 Tax=Inhella inkyongensis TaxID=392593 RepID=A0A840S5B7_9BURK|nr:ATP-binding protein [Inhella inkyongensis]MBB5204762.1 heavy metal sensor kinase [Inhella inkyongensis]
MARLSYRQRLLLATTLVLGLVVAALLASGGALLMRAEGQRLDERLCMEARRVAAPGEGGPSLPRLLADIALKLHLETDRQLLLQALAPAGQLRLQSPQWTPDLNPEAWAWRPEPRRGPAAAGPDPRGRCELAELRWKGGDWRAARVSSPAGQAVLAADLDALQSELSEALLQALCWVLLPALALTVLSAWLLSGYALRPLNRLRDAMRALTPRALDQRLPTAGADREFRELIDSYNLMLARLEASFHQASRFSADAAHELRTPLAILQGRIEQAMTLEVDREAQAEWARLLDEVARLTGITRKLLLLSQADAGRLALSPERVDLSAELAQLADDARMVARQQLRVDIEAGLQLQADALLLRQLLNNLMGNALRHGRPEGWIALHAAREGEGVAVHLRNDCAPLNAAVRERLFERFYRADPAHGRQVEGSGLGLSLAREIARAHGGDLSLEASPDDELALRLWLPLASPR